MSWADKTECHNCIKDCLHEHAQAGGLQPTLEAPGILDEKDVADELMKEWRRNGVGRDVRLNVLLCQAQVECSGMGGNSGWSICAGTTEACGR